MFYTSFESVPHSDVSLLLFDSKNELPVNAHRSILCMHSAFFRATFCDGFKEKSMSSIPINVVDLRVAYDVISEDIYQIKSTLATHLPQWKYLMTRYLIQLYFQLEPKPDANGVLDQLHLLDIPVAGFKSTLQFVDTIGYSDKAKRFLLKNLPVDYPLSDIPVDVLQSAVSNQHDIVFVTTPGMIYYVDHTALSDITQIDSGGEDVWSGAGSADGRFFAIGGIKGSIQVYADGKLLKLLQICNNRIWDIRFNANATELSFGDNKGNVYQVNIASGNIINHFCSNSPVWAIDWSSDELLIAAGGVSSYIFVWNTKTKEQITLSNNDSCRAMAFSPDCKLILCGTDAGQVNVFDIQTKRVIRTISGLTGIIRSVKYSPDGKYIACMSHDKRTIFASVSNSTSNVIQNIGDGSSNGNRCGAFINDQLFAIGTLEGLHIIDRKTGRVLHKIKTPSCVTGIHTKRSIVPWDVQQRIQAHLKSLSATELPQVLSCTQ